MDSFVDFVTNNFSKDDISCILATSYMGILLFVLYLLGRFNNPKIKTLIKQGTTDKLVRDLDLEERHVPRYDPKDDELTNEERLESILQEMYVSTLFADPNIRRVHYFPQPQVRRRNPGRSQLSPRGQPFFPPVSGVMVKR